MSSLRGTVKAVNVLAMRKQKIYMEHSNVWRPDSAQSNVPWEPASCGLLAGTGNVSRRHAPGEGRWCLDLLGGRPAACDLGSQQSEAAR